MPLRINSIDITIKIKPIILCIILNPNFPNLLDKILDSCKIMKVVIKTINKAKNNDIFLLLVVDSDDKIIMEAIEPGPAINGIARGVYAISFFSSASFSSLGVVLVLDLFDSIISKLILSNSIPPAILNP